jgi:hypothetical protein
MTEAEWQDMIIGSGKDLRDTGVAILHGWHVLHIRAGATSRGRWSVPVSGDMGKGWPDLILARPPRIIAVELKVGTKQATQDQVRVLEILQSCGIPTYVWRPDDWDMVVATLR